MDTFVTGNLVGSVIVLAIVAFIVYKMVRGFWNAF